jgi:hypothetical protein
LKSIHEAVSSSFCPENISKAIEAQASENVAFEDALQALEVIPRATKLNDVSEISKALLTSIIVAGNDAQKWKLLILTILRKRYHMKSPEAKSIVRDRVTKKEKGHESEQEDTSGHGERMTFYILFICLHYLSTMDKESSIDEYVIDFSTKTCQCLGRLAIAAGGTRDICTLMEHLVYDHLVRHGIVNIRDDKGNKRAISAAMIKLTQNMPISTVLSDLVTAAAELLDSDFSLITSSNTAEKKDESKEEEIKLQSTINTFIPHHDRGSKERRLTQSVAEFMIWKETKHSQTNPKFVQAVTDICTSSSSLSASDDSSMDDKIVSSLHVMQTSIRRFRKELNESSRKRGFSLCTSYSMEPSSITLSMVKRGRVGDVASLQRLASKKRDEKIMKLIANRNADPSKAMPMLSVRELCSNWIPLESVTKNEDGNDELTALQLKIQEAKVRATVELLESKIPSESSKKDVVLASLDMKATNDCCAVLVAAALEPKCKWDDKEDIELEDSENRNVTLFIGNEKHDVSTPALVMTLLDQICTREMNESAQTPTTTKDVQNLIERHLGESSHLLLVASTDIKIEQRVLAKLQQDKSTVHCHLNDDFSYRMEREKAKVGDITITLAWDNECDLDLSCICPNGDRIYYGDKYGGGEIGGGYLDVDMNVHGESKEPVENIFFGDAEKGIQAAIGKYKVVVQNYAYHGKTHKDPDSIPWRLRVSKNGEIHNYSGECRGTGSSSDVIAVEFEYEGRKAPPPEEIGSALQSSKLISVTSSTGETIDSISNLLSIFNEHTELSDVQNLVQTDVDETMEEKEDEADAPTRPLMAENKTFDITNRDRLYLKLSKLPKSFHLQVNQTFLETTSLIEYTASELAKRLLADKVPVQELKQAGYQEEIISIVTEKMRKFGL